MNTHSIIQTFKDRISIIFKSMSKNEKPSNRSDDHNDENVVAEIRKAKEYLITPTGPMVRREYR